MTCAQTLVTALSNRYPYKGRGPEWILLTEVRNAAGFDASRSLDAMAVSLWPSAKGAILGFEIKVSRGDWIRELKDPRKAGAFTPYCTEFCVVAPPGVVKRDELPEGWGLLELVGERLRCSHAATSQPAEPMPHGMLASMLKRAGGSPAKSDSELLHEMARLRVEMSQWRQRAVDWEDRFNAVSQTMQPTQLQIQETNHV